jgi:hypothetical protein
LLEFIHQLHSIRVTRTMNVADIQVFDSGFAYDHGRLDYMTEGKLKIKRTENAADGVTWQVERKRSVMPLTPLQVLLTEGVSKFHPQAGKPYAVNERLRAE